jgi:hypothetical protein
LEKSLNISALPTVRPTRSPVKEQAGAINIKSTINQTMKKTSVLNLALTAFLLAAASVAIPTASADCGGSGGKKECPAPSPSPSPAK